MDLQASLDEFAPFAAIFERLGISYQLGGSVASSAYGFPRGTKDIDVEADLLPQHVIPLVANLEAGYAITSKMVWEALQERSFFSVIPYHSITKIDIFVPKDRDYDREAAKRRKFGVPLDNSIITPYWINSVEDTILRKLEWYRMGNEVSEQKWLDVLGIFKTQRFDVDFAYLRHWAKELGVTDLLERALEQSGLKEQLDAQE